MADKITTIIEQTVKATIKAMLVQEKPSDIFKATEKRLRAYPILCDNVEDLYPKDIADLKKEGVPGRSKSIVFWSNSGGVKMAPEELQQHRIEIVQAKAAADQREVDTMAAAMDYIDSDPYKMIIYDYYFSNKSVDDIAAESNIHPNTVMRNKNRLVRVLACRLYGAQALGGA